MWMKKTANRLVVGMAFLFMAIMADGEVEDDDYEEGMLIQYIEHKATFPGGWDSLSAYMKKNLIYPETALKNDNQGTVKVVFCVDVDGKVSNVSVVQSVDSLLDKEAVRVVESMPNWRPATRRGKPVKSKFVFPIKFRASDTIRSM